jgi:hypothetical protein
MRATESHDRVQLDFGVGAAQIYLYGVVLSDLIQIESKTRNNRAVQLSGDSLYL